MPAASGSPGVAGQALDQVPYLPTGQYFYRTACRGDPRIVQDQFVFWNARRAT